MKKTFTKLAAMLIFSATFLTSPAPAAISIYIFELDGDVVFYYRGSVNTSTAEFQSSGSGLAPVFRASSAAIQFSALDRMYAHYTLPDFAGFPSFGPGGQFGANDFSGDLFVISGGQMAVPQGYVSGSFITGNMRATGQTLDSLGIIPGVYSVTWGPAEDSDSITLFAGTPPTLNIPMTHIEFPGSVRFDTLPDVAFGYIIEWAPHPDGPWSSSWEGLQRIPPTEAPHVTVAVPMFFRAKAIGFDP